MAGRFLPQRDVNLITRVTKELVGDKQNSKDGSQRCCKDTEVAIHPRRLLGVPRYLPRALQELRCPYECGEILRDLCSA